ncbi:MAG: DUF4184 family protein, partial [Acidimicrobiales bacterium]
MADWPTMPVTFPAHQGLIAGAKLRWPDRVDGTALCIGAAAPDLAYALGDWMNRQSHTLVGLLVWSLPFTVVATLVTRWRAPGSSPTCPISARSRSAPTGCSVSG